MAVKAPPAAVATYNWTGFYLGVEGGGAWGHSQYGSADPTFNPGLPITPSFNLSSGLFGGTFGYNWQINNWLVGVEGDLSWVHKAGGAFGIPPFATTSINATTERWLGTDRLRLGFIPADRWLLYVTGGLAAADVEATVSPVGVGPFSQTQTRTGWTAGAGVEAAVAQSWSLKLEYLYVGLPTGTYFSPNIPLINGGAVITRSVSANDNIVRAGINYRWPVAGLSPARAIAAGMPVKAPVAAAPAFSWTGCYVGANGGYGWNTGKSSYNAVNATGDPINGRQNPPFNSLVFVPAPSNTGGSGGLGGVGAGCNWQNQRWVFGLEGDIDRMQFSGSPTTAVATGATGQIALAPTAFTPANSTGTAVEQVALRWLGTVRGRVGLAAQDRLLLFVTGGAAIGEVSSQGSVNVLNPGPLLDVTWGGSQPTITRGGFTVGGGAEWAFADRWTAKAEYLWYDLGSVSHPLACTLTRFPGGCGTTLLALYPTLGSTSAAVNGGIVRVGVNYKLN
jgi:outer membrane immunogenic protein